MQANHLDIPGVPSGFAPQISSSLCPRSSLSLSFPFSLPLRRFPRRGAAERRQACSRSCSFLAEDLRVTFHPWPFETPRYQLIYRRKQRMENRSGNEPWNSEISFAKIFEEIPMPEIVRQIYPAQKWLPLKYILTKFCE